MDNENNVQLEGVILDCSLNEKKDIQYASMTVCTSKQRKGGEKENSYHRIRFAVTSENAKTIARISEDCLKNKARLSSSDVKTLSDMVINRVSVNGSLVVDRTRQPLILTDEKDVAFNDKTSGKDKNEIILKGKLHKVDDVSPVGAMVLLNISKKDNETVLLPVFISVKNNPEVWAEISSGNIEPGQNIKIKGKLEGKIYSHNNDNIFRVYVNAKIFKPVRRQKKQTQKGGPSIS